MGSRISKCKMYGVYFITWSAVMKSIYFFSVKPVSKILWGKQNTKNRFCFIWSTWIHGFISCLRPVHVTAFHCKYISDWLLVVATRSQSIKFPLCCCCNAVRGKKKKKLFTVFINPKQAYTVRRQKAGLAGSQSVGQRCSQTSQQVNEPLASTEGSKSA